MSHAQPGEGLTEVFVKGAVFALGAAMTGLVLGRMFGREPEVVVVTMPNAEPPGDETGSSQEHASPQGSVGHSMEELR